MSFEFIDRESAYPNRYLVTPESGTPYYVTLTRADEPITDGTPLNAETLNKLFTDEDFSNLPNLYLWKMYTADPNTVTNGYTLEDVNNYRIVSKQANAGRLYPYINYASGINIADGSVQFDYDAGVGLYAYGTLWDKADDPLVESDLSVLLDKYVRPRNEIDVVYIASDAKLTQTNFTSGGVTYSGIFVNKAKRVKVFGSLGYVASLSPDEYPLTGINENDGYWYEYVGKWGDCSGSGITMADVSAAIKEAVGEGGSSATGASARGIGVSVKEYGATGDGVTDDTVAIAAAIADLNPGDTLYFPEGVYRVSNIDLKSDMTVQGAGWCSVIQLLDATTDYSGRNNCLNVENINNVIIRDIKLDGTRPTQQATADSQDGRLNGIHIRRASNVLVENVWMYNNGYHGCIATYASDVIFERCRVTDNGFRPIHGHTEIYNCRISNCVCENNGLGLTGGSGNLNDSIFFFGVQRLVINDNIVRSNRRGCITVECDFKDSGASATDLIDSHNITISGNVCECYEILAAIKSVDADDGVYKFSSKGIVLIGGPLVMDNVAITGNTIKNAYEAIDLSSMINSTHSINAVISGNTIQECYYGVCANNVADVTLCGNQFKNLTYCWMYANNVYNMTVSNNMVISPGIMASNMCRVFNSYDVVIQGNTLIGNNARAVYVEGNTCNNIVVMNNTLFGFTAADPILNTTGQTVGNLSLTKEFNNDTGGEDDGEAGGEDGDDTSELDTMKVRVSPYENNGFVSISKSDNTTFVINNTSSNYLYTSPVKITASDVRYELNTYVSIPAEYNPAEYDYGSESVSAHPAIVFLNGADLSGAVGIATLTNDIGTREFSGTCIAGNTKNLWGVQITIDADSVRALFPGATHVVMQVGKAYSVPGDLPAGYFTLNDGYAYIHRKGLVAGGDGRV